MAKARGNGDMKFTISIDPSPTILARAFEEMGEQYKNWRPIWPRMATLLRDGIQQNLRSRGSTVGDTWEQPDAEYLRRKAKRFGRIEMVRLGLLTSQVTDVREGVRDFGDRHLSFGSNLPYARAVNFGGEGHKFIAWSSPMRTRALQLMSDYSSEVIRKTSEKISKAVSK
jgi:phage gpG-like protein